MTLLNAESGLYCLESCTTFTQHKFPLTEGTFGKDEIFMFHLAL